MNFPRRLSALALTAVLAGLAAQLPAQTLPGHSMHAEVFNEGPRQAAFLMGGTGPIEFSITTSSAEAQQFFNQGVGQLHGFWYFEAERSFRQAALLDPDCAMAYWGMAMANGNNAKRARDFIRQAEIFSESVTDRERRYIEALVNYRREDKRGDADRKKALAADLESLVAAYPRDIEAKAFFCLQRWQNGGLKDKDREEINTLLNEVLAVQPLHPVHHYRIHLWDSGTSTNAVNSAALNGASAPATAHMWHMSGHTYSKLKRYSDAAWQQEASARTDHAYMIKNQVMPDQIHNFAHNNEWLIRNLNNLGAVTRAVELAQNMIELPRHPKYNTVSRGSASYGFLRLLETLVRFEKWSDLVALGRSHYLPVTGNKDHDTRRHHALALAHLHLGDAKSAEPHLAALETIQKENQKKDADARKAAEARKAADAKKTAAPKAAETKSGDAKKSSPAAKSKSAPTRGGGGLLATATSVDAAIAEINALRALLQDDKDTAKTWLGKAGSTDAGRLARLHLRLGDEKKAIELATKALKTDEIQALANYVDIAWRAGKPEDAKKRFGELRKICAEADLTAPVLARLAPVAQALELPTDWRPPLQRAADFGTRPPLESLGPFRWQSPPAKDWRLPRHDGSTLSLADFRNRPVLVIFYLGHGCTHCIEQLAAFAPLTENFKKLGVSLVGVSTDSASGLHKTEQKAGKDGTFPFPLVANPELDVFKRYRAYDDFERMPLHGTFLISGDGRILWQDISYQPFTETAFLLKEAERLLGLQRPAPLALRP